MSPLNHRLTGKLLRGAEGRTLDDVMAAAKRDALRLTRKLDRAVKRDTPCELSAREAGAVLAALRSWAGVE